MALQPRVIADLNWRGQLDAASRVRVSELTTLGDYRQMNDDQPLYFDREVIGTATQTYDQSEGGVIMAVAAANDKAICQSKMWHNYQSGKSHLVEITQTDFQPQEGVRKRAGYFSSSTSTPFSADLDGIFFEVLSDGVYCKVYKNGTEIHSAVQSAWNIDRFDGSNGALNPSGFNVSGEDWKHFSIGVINFLYLGGSYAAFAFLVGNEIFPVHIYKHALLSGVETPMIQSPNQPVRWEIEALSAVSGSMNQICAQVSTEGAINDIGIPRGIITGTTDIDCNSAGTEYAIIGVRLKAAYKNITFIPTLIQLLATTNDDFIWQLKLNPSVAGTFTYGDIADSAIQFAIGDTAGNPSTNTVTGGVVLASGLGTGNDLALLPSEPSLRAGSDIDGTLHEIVLTVTPLGNGLDIFGSLNLEEFK
jgi:hypothetical protein